MVEVVVFGKPRSFESYEFDFGVHRVQEVENSHHEPIIKPVGYSDIIFHYYQKEGIAGWEVYRRCHGYDSDRPGIVFGVGIKSDKDFGLIDTMRNLIMPLWEDFAQAFLDKNYKFQFESIVNALKTTKWSAEEEEKVRNNVSKEDIKTASQEKLLLLLSVDNPGEIKAVEGLIKEYNDVYIASSPDIFQNLINKDVLAKQANNEIRIVKDGKIVSLQKPEAEKSSDDKNGNKGWITWIWGGKGSNSSDSETKDTGGGRKGLNRLPKLVAAAAVIAFIAVIAWLFVFKSKPADRIVLAEAPESGYITDSFDLKPTLCRGESNKRVSTKVKDVKWIIEGNGKKYVAQPLIAEDKHLYLQLNDEEYYSSKHPETQIVIYGIVKDDTINTENNKYKLPEYKGEKANYIELRPPKDNNGNVIIIQNKFPDNKDLIKTIAYKKGNDNPNESIVYTTKDDVILEVSDSNIAEIKKDTDGNWKLFVKPNRPEIAKDTEITVSAKLKNDIVTLCEQKYIIAKKESNLVVKTGMVLCQDWTDAPDTAPYNILPADFLSSDIKITRFIASRNQETAYSTRFSGKGSWKIKNAAGELVFTSSNNPMKIDIDLPSGKYTITFTYPEGTSTITSTATINIK